MARKPAAAAADGATVRALVLCDTSHALKIGQVVEAAPEFVAGLGTDVDAHKEAVDHALQNGAQVVSR